MTALQVFVVSLRGFSLTVVMKDVSQSDRKIRVLVICKISFGLAVEYGCRSLLGVTSSLVPCLCSIEVVLGVALLLFVLDTVK